MKQVLVLLSRSARITARDLAFQAPVSGRAAQLFGDHVVIAELSPAECSQLADMPDVAGVYPNAVPAEAEMPDDLTGRVAIGAWNSRVTARRAGADSRVGDGAAWDDPRFEQEGRPSAGERHES